MTELGVQLSPNGATPQAMIQAAAAYEKHGGFESIWVGDHLIDYFNFSPQEPATECFSALAAIACATSSIRLGSLVSSPFFRSPSLLASTAGTLAELSDGRFELGIGTGGVKSEHRALGFDFPRAPDRIRRTRHTLEALRALQKDEPVSIDNSTVRLDGAVGHSRFSEVRIVFGALGPVSARLGASIADEVNTIDYAHTYEAEKILAVVRNHAEEKERQITTSLMVPDLETKVGGGRHPEAGMSRAEKLSVDRLIYRILPPYPDPDDLIASETNY